MLRPKSPHCKRHKGAEEMSTRLLLYIAGALNAFAAGFAAGRGSLLEAFTFALVAAVIAAYDLQWFHPPRGR